MKNILVALTLSLLPFSMGFAQDNAPLNAQVKPFLKTPAQVSQDELNALVLLSGSTSDVYFSEPAVAQLTEEITLIKTKFPEVSGINDIFADAGLFSNFLLDLNEETMANLQPQIVQAAQLPETVTGYKWDVVNVSDLMGSLTDVKKIQQLVPIESIKANYSVSAHSPFRISLFTGDFSYLVNINALAFAIAPYTELRYLEANSMAGDGDHIVRKVNANNTIEYVFSSGGGDCPAGCTEWTSHRFILDPATKTVTKTSEDHEPPF